MFYQEIRHDFSLEKLFTIGFLDQPLYVDKSSGSSRKI